MATQGCVWPGARAPGLLPGPQLLALPTTPARQRPASAPARAHASLSSPGAPPAGGFSSLAGPPWLLAVFLALSLLRPLPLPVIHPLAHLFMQMLTPQFQSPGNETARVLGKELERDQWGLFLCHLCLCPGAVAPPGGVQAL